MKVIIVLFMGLCSILYSFTWDMPVDIKFNPRDTVSYRICYDEIKQDSSLVIDSNLIEASIFLYNTDSLLVKTYRNEIETFCERKLVVNYAVNGTRMPEINFSKATFASIFNDELGKDFLKRALLYSASIKKINKEYLEIFISLSVPDTDYTNDIDLFVRNNGDFRFEFSDNYPRLP